jgi:rhamnogalacturonyl hydrolase YesR
MLIPAPIFRLALGLFVGIPLSLAASETQVLPAGGARVLPIAGDGFAGSSVNVLAGLQSSLITEGAVQYAAFYAHDHTLVLARRTLGANAWITQCTSYSASVDDAHRAVAIAIDGAGFLHVAWDHHGNALNYARGVAAGSLELGPRQAMTGQNEDNVTYPAFLRLASGDLLFFYRDGGSGRGNLALNRYDTAADTWSQVHANLLDGEGRRNAYASATIDPKGVLHLAWVWRESPDVATNHDIAYARSDDAGVSWKTVAGAPLRVPITADAADYALRIGQNRSLMNPPSIAADNNSRPYVANYWCPEGSNIPQYHLVHHDGQRWHVQQITRRTTPFTLAGAATKRPPISRSVVLTRQPWRKPREAHLVYRDDERGGKIIVASCPDIAAPSWYEREITTNSVGAWEPSLDPQQWQRFTQLHMLVQLVEQRDGNDREAARVPPSTVASLIWSPFIAGMAEGPRAAPAAPAAGALDAAIDPTQVLALMERAADYHLAQPMRYDPAGWENAPFNIGALALAKISKSPRFHDAIMQRAEANQWKPAARLHHADDHCVVQAYAELHRHHQDPKMFAPSRERLDAVLANPARVTLDWGLPNDVDRWSWCDALFMGPASWLMVYEATKDRRYLDHMNREWWATVDALYVPGDGLFARDQSFLDLREPNGRGLYWSRGNGWVAAGLARTLDLFPKDHPDHARYVALYHDMMDTILAAQQFDGLWRPGLLDPVAHTARETSGSSFYTFALTWGINRGLLERERVEPAVRRAWHALSACVTSEGRLEHVQNIGAAPEGFDVHNTEPFGVGAFLLAGSEVFALYQNAAAP